VERYVVTRCHAACIHVHGHATKVFVELAKKFYQRAAIAAIWKQTSNAAILQTGKKAIL